MPCTASRLGPTQLAWNATSRFPKKGWKPSRGRVIALPDRKPAPQKVAELRFNTYGFNAGGPVDFWKKDHQTFFFYNMEWRALIQGQTLNQTVPSTAWYGGAFPSSIA